MDAGEENPENADAVRSTPVPQENCMRCDRKGMGRLNA